MSTTATIVAIISVIGCLILATRGAPFRRLGTGGTVKMALIWATIILGLFLIIQITGLRIEQ